MVYKILREFLKAALWRITPVFTTNRPDTKDKVLYKIKDFKRDIENLKQFKRELLKHNYIILFLVIILIKLEFNIFFKLTIIDL
jgi:hypothetical protein